jgi:hypothetical protein
MLTALAIAVVSGVVYLLYARRPEAPSGGSSIGIAYGIAGFALMLYAGLLGARKRVPVWRLGRAQSWMRGHLWLGLVSFPLIVFHAGFTFGGGLTLVLMWLFVVVIASGVWGAYLQHTLPRRMMRDVPMETIYEQIEHVRAQLLMEADTIVAGACGKLEVETVVPAARGNSQEVGETGEKTNGKGWRQAIGTSAEAEAAAAALATIVRVEAEESAPLRDFYLREMRAFVQHPSAGHPLGDGTRATARFEKLRALVPASFHPPIRDLENICEEERQLMRQSRMHLVLHGWQLVHVPLSIALLTLAVVHIVVALRF